MSVPKFRDASSGNLYVANAADNTIGKFNSQGYGTLFAGSGLDNPRGLAFDSSGNLYVANYDDNTIERFNAQGKGTVFINSGLSYPRYIALQPVPEPSVCAFIVLGLATAASLCHRKRAA
ncbi:MAG: SBBP repeat-containing protein [Verrucomicrobiota bacterium]